MKSVRMPPCGAGSSPGTLHRNMLQVPLLRDSPDTHQLRIQGTSCALVAAKPRNMSPDVSVILRQGLLYHYEAGAMCFTAIVMYIT